MMRSLFAVWAALLFAACSKPKASSERPEAIKPNIIIILADDLGYNDVGFNGSEEILTPNIDKIARNGVTFTNAYVSYAVCGPSRAGLITGRYQDRFGFSRNPLFAPKDSLQGLPLSEETLAEALRKADYKSMAIGKWHLGAHKSLRPLNRGFDEFYGFLSGGHNYFPEDLVLNDISEVRSQYEPYKTKLLRNNTRVELGEYLTDALSKEAVEFVKRNQRQPFFLYLAYNAPHTPMQATEKYLERYKHIEDKKRRTYAAMVSAVDDGVGNLLDVLAELDLEKSTIVYFLSDNGGPEPHNGSDNGALREGKGTLFEGGIRVPFAMQWVGMIPQGVKYNKPIISLDIFATALAYAGVKPKNDLDGINLVPYLNGEKKEAPHKQLFWRQYDSNNVAIRDGDFKFLRTDGKSNELYNIKNDIGEQTPLNDAKKLKDLELEHKAWNKKNKNPLFLGLSQDEEYNKLHPERYINVEKY